MLELSIPVAKKFWCILFQIDYDMIIRTPLLNIQCFLPNQKYLTEMSVFNGLLMMRVCRYGNRPWLKSTTSKRSWVAENPAMDASTMPSWTSLIIPINVPLSNLNMKKSIVLIRWNYRLSIDLEWFYFLDHMFLFSILVSCITKVKFNTDEAIFNAFSNIPCTFPSSSVQQYGLKRFA